MAITVMVVKMAIAMMVIVYVCVLCVLCSKKDKCIFLVHLVYIFLAHLWERQVFFVLTFARAGILCVLRPTD